jgi:hypothetical protein
VRSSSGVLVVPMRLLCLHRIVGVRVGGWVGACGCACGGLGTRPNFPHDPPRARQEPLTPKP